MGLLGKDSITITDITDVNPIRLDLASSQPIYQTKRASGYEPDYTSSPLIITPSLYFGQEEVNREKYIDKITFYINGVLVVNTETIYVENTELYIKENLNQNIKVEAVIENIIDERTKVEYERVSESLSFYLLSYDSSGYTAFIDSEDGRYDFSSDKTDSIKLVAHLYLGTTPVSAEYTWKKSSDPNTIIGEAEKIEIKRENVYSHENFICSMKYEGVSYVATCAIDDRTDVYTGAIISDTSLVMTPILNTANLTCKIFRNSEEINLDNITYKWVYYTNNSTSENPIGETKEITIVLGTENNPPKDNFSLYCIATIDDKYKVVSYLPISYSVSYTPILTPKTIFIPSNADGSYKGAETEVNKVLRFFLQGEDGAPIDAGIDLDSISISDLTSTVVKENNKYSISFSLSLDAFKTLDVSSMFEINYTYKNQQFNEEFYIVKSVQGNNGRDGVDGASYSLILSNDFHRFAGKEVYAVGGQKVSTNISFFKGDEEMPIEVIKIGSLTSVTTTPQPATVGLQANINQTGFSTGKEITFTTIDRALKDGGALPIEVKVNLNGKEQVFVTVFNYEINYEGNAYFLSFSNGTSVSYLPSKDSFTPNKIEFYAYYRKNGSGENILYTDGKVYVSIDGGTKTKLSGTSAFYSYVINNSVKNNLTFYLYNSIANNSNPEDAYLMDRETISILTSLEGAEIGGDNLLRFTRTLQWDIQNGSENLINIYKDVDTNIATFNFSNLNGVTSGDYSTCVLASPKIYIEKEIENKTFCISFYLKNDSENYFNEPLFEDGNIHASIFAYDNNGSQLASKSILYMSNTSSNNAKVENEEVIKRGKWVRVYQTFDLNIFNEIDLSSVKYYKIKIMGVIKSNINFTYNFSIKKPKLEVGNTLTAWSMATNDILFENLDVDLENLDNQSLVNLLNTQISNILTNNTNISDLSKKINITMTDSNGKKINFTNLQEFQEYYDGYIGKIIDNKISTNNTDVINTQFNSLEANYNLRDLKLISNKIKLGYDSKQNGEPYMLFDTSIGENGFETGNTMKLTTTRLSFISKREGELAYFGNNSMTIKRARVSEGYYLGTNDTGYLVMRTTPQGCAFMWKDDFDE